MSVHYIVAFVAQASDVTIKLPGALFPLELYIFYLCPTYLQLHTRTTYYAVLSALVSF